MPLLGNLTPSLPQELSATDAPTACVSERTIRLRSAGVSVRAHANEPEQLMIAEDEGHVHFVDLRVASARPSLTRSLPPSFGPLDAGGLRDADW